MPEQRRTVLEYLLNCHPYPIRKESLSIVSEVLEEEETMDLENSTLEQSTLEIKMGVPDCNTSQDLIRKDDRNIEEISHDTAGHDEHSDEDTCAICLEQFLHGELINSSNACQHFFHKECLLGWLDQQNICPCCRVTMIPENQWELAINQECIHSPHQQGLHA
jgi:Ring finger domain